MFDDPRVPARAWRKVMTEPNSGCWLWTGSTCQHGYGMTCSGRGGHSVRAHRFFYERLVGPIELPELDHKCRQRCCVNPDHLRQVTRRENVLLSSSFAAKNAKKTHCPSGHEYTSENTYFCVSRPNGRYCRACHRIKTNKISVDRAARRAAKRSS